MCETDFSNTLFYSRTEPGVRTTPPLFQDTELKWEKVPVNATVIRDRRAIAENCHQPLSSNDRKHAPCPLSSLFA